MEKATYKQINYIKKAHFHIRNCISEENIEKYNLIRMPYGKKEASVYISWLGDWCRKNQHLLNNSTYVDRGVDKSYMSRMTRNAFDYYGDNDYNHKMDISLSDEDWECFGSINCKDDM